ncbi:SigB/SigF/SigG family RNA polymerase sigma factor [Mycobacterium cookii]|uniref:SigB/SigF/SigG family RNA polymerase sigma factor n=1 Tax=Nocardioides furvisabuli TaxID=375542 RepID=A0ABN2XG77_9ACTN|nr:SigB/SigF/SigG family RNA polymerase sigma factor [Nocardioides furvisabuli]
MTTLAIVPQQAEQQLLARPAQSSDRQRQVHELIEGHLAVARSMAARYRNRGIDLEDLEQVALVGLTKAAQRFDARVGEDFLAYAAPTIRGELRRHFRDAGWMIRVPRRVQEMQARIARAEQDLLAALGRSPRPTEVAAHLGADLDDVVEALSADGCFRPTSIDTTAGEGDDTIASLIGWHDPGLASVEARLVLGTALADLPERERRILHWRFVDERTQAEIAELLGLTQAQVSRILSRMLRQLRAGLSEPLPAA